MTDKKIQLNEVGELTLEQQAKLLKDSAEADNRPLQKKVTLCG